MLAVNSIFKFLLLFFFKEKKSLPTKILILYFLKNEFKTLVAFSIGHFIFKNSLIIFVFFFPVEDRRGSLIFVANLSRIIEKFKKNNFWIIGLDNKKTKFKKKFEIPKKSLLILGAEEKGLRYLTKKKCEPCSGNTSKLSMSEIQNKLSEINDAQL